MDERATSFGSVAEFYDRYRPAPPAEVVDWLLPGGVERVADVCAGTGSFSRVLAGRVGQVVAIDLDPRMLAVLRARSPTPGAVCADGVVLPARAEVFDAALVSSGWHWLDPARAVAEMARILRPGGVLGVVWNGPNRRVDWVAELLGPRRVRADGHSRPRRELSIPAGQPFGQVEHRMIEWSLPRTPSELIGLAGTYSGVISSSSDQRGSVVRRAVEVLDQNPALSGRSSIDLPMSARCWRVIRLARGIPNG